MTITAYNLGMRKSVKIAELKAHLSEHLRAVRRGRRLTILDRDTPIAELVPYDRSGRGTLSVTRHRSKATPTGRVRLPRPLKLERDVVEALLEERGER
jgi:prevent-host-death family protein